MPIRPERFPTQGICTVGYAHCAEQDPTVLFSIETALAAVVVAVALLISIGLVPNIKIKNEGLFRANGIIDDVGICMGDVLSIAKHIVLHIAKGFPRL